MEIDFPVLLDLDIPHVYSYSIESTLAEKFEAIVSLGLANSRYKDFYDIYVILQDQKVNEVVLKQAVIQTFSHRKTSFDDIVIFDDSFNTGDKRAHPLDVSGYARRARGTWLSSYPPAYSPKHFFGRIEMPKSSCGLETVLEATSNSRICKALFLSATDGSESILLFM